MTRSHHHLSRRQVLLGGTAVGTAGFIAACGGNGGGNDGGGNAPSGWDWPQNIPFDGPEPDLPPVPEGVNAGFTKYPDISTLVQTVSAPPGDGDPITAMTPNYGPAPLDKSRNNYWKFLNEKLGSELDIRMVPGTDYSNVFATTVASGEMPNIFTIDALPRMPEFLESQAVDLTDALAGEGIAKYPNIAVTPQDAWKYSVFNGRIYTIPIFRGLRTTWAMLQRADYMKEYGYNTEPTSFAELLDIAKDFTDASANRWAFADFPGDFLRQSLGIANEWGLDGDTFTSAWADERQAEVFEAGKQLIEAGVIHPEAFDDSERKTRFADGSTLFVQDGLGGWNAFYSKVSTNFPEFTEFGINGMKMFNFDEGYTGQAWRGPDVEVQGVIGKSAQDRLETVLGVANWIAAPFGSIEKHEQMFGVEGEHYNIEDGNPIKTEAGRDEWLNLQLMVSTPFTLLDLNFPGATTGLHEFQVYLAENALRNAADGLYSEELVANGGAFDTTFRDLTNDIVQGRRSTDDWTSEVDDFMLSTGQTIIDQLTEARDAAE